MKQNKMKSIIHVKEAREFATNNYNCMSTSLVI